MTRLLPIPFVSPRSSGPILAAITLALMSSVADALTSDTFTYSSTRTGYYSIHPSDLAPDSHTAASNFIVDFVNSNLTTTSDLVCFLTGIHLPQSAIIRRVTTYYKSAAFVSILAHLVRNNLETDTTESLVSQDPEDKSGVRRSVSATVPAGMRVVRNDLYSYAYQVCITQKGTFEGARITYTFTSAGD